MRVTAASFGNDFRTQIAKLAERQMRVQRQIATGQRIDSPSDDPQAMRRVLDLRAELRVLNQYQDNIGKVRENSTVAYSSLTAMKKLNDRAGEIATLADASKPAEALQAYGKEINQLLEEAVRLANTKHRDVYIFSGTNSTSATYGTVPPFHRGLRDAWTCIRRIAPLINLTSRRKKDALTVWQRTAARATALAASAAVFPEKRPEAPDATEPPT